MSTPSQIAADASRARRRFLVGGAVVLLTAAVGGGWLLGRIGTDQEPADQPPPTSDPTANQEVFEPLAGEILIDDRHPAQWPHSPEGAASAVLAHLAGLSTNDPAALAASTSVYYGQDFTTEDVEAELLPDRAQQISDARPTGTVFDDDTFPASGSYFYIRPLGVWWEQVDDDTVEVQVLAEEEISDGQGLVFTRPYIHGRLMRWDAQVRGGDWVVEEISDPTEAEMYIPDPEEYTLDHPSWTPVDLAWDEAEQDGGT